jgi:hypothetical protein
VILCWNVASNPQNTQWMDDGPPFSGGALGQHDPGFIPPILVGKSFETTSRDA